MSVCCAVSFAVVYPVVPATMRSASTTTTERPARASSQAVHSPAIPAPMTTTSAVMSSVSVGYPVDGGDAIQCDSTLGGYPLSYQGNPVSGGCEGFGGGEAR